MVYKSITGFKISFLSLNFWKYIFFVFVDRVFELCRVSLNKDGVLLVLFVFMNRNISRTVTLKLNKTVHVVNWYTSKSSKLKKGYGIYIFEKR